MASYLGQCCQKGVICDLEVVEPLLRLAADEDVIADVKKLGNADNTRVGMSEYVYIYEKEREAKREIKKERETGKIEKEGDREAEMCRQKL